MNTMFELLIFFIWQVKQSKFKSPMTYLRNKKTIICTLCLSEAKKTLLSTIDLNQASPANYLRELWNDHKDDQDTLYKVDKSPETTLTKGLWRMLVLCCIWEKKGPVWLCSAAATPLQDGFPLGLENPSTKVQTNPPRCGNMILMILIKMIRVA